MNKKVHFYFPKKKIDVENQTFFGDYEHLPNYDNIYDRIYQSTLNSLFDSEEPENEIEKMIKYDYSSRITFYMTRLHDDRFEPLTPSNEIFSNASPKICLDIRNEGFIIWNCTNQANVSDQNFRSDQVQYLSFSFDNDADVIYSIVQSFVSGKINFSLLKIIDKLQISYDPFGSILCEIADYRFDSDSTCLYDFDGNGVSRKRINLQISNNSIYYIFTLAKKAFIRKKSVHLSNASNDAKPSNMDNKGPSRSLSSVASLPNVSNSSQLANSSSVNSVPESFFPIKKNDSTPNLMINNSLSQLGHNKMLDDSHNSSFNQVRSESLPINNFQNDQSKMIGIPNQNFIPEPAQSSINDYMQMQGVDPAISQINNSVPNHMFKDSTFQIPIQSMSSKPIQSDNSQIQIQTQYNKHQHQQLSKQKQQHSQQKQQLQKLQQLQKQQLQQQQQPPFQSFPIQNQAHIPNPELSQSTPINIKEEAPPKSKSKSNSSLSQNTSNISSSLNTPSPLPMVSSNTIYETEGKLILLLHPNFCSDPSPDVCRVSSILDFRKKMWDETPSLFMKNYDQMKARLYPNPSTTTNFRTNRQSYQINPPNEKIMIPETINQMFISKNMAIKFTNY